MTLKSRRLRNKIGTSTAEPDDRYADISLMQQALDEYVEGSGLESSRVELERFFAAPAAYQMALEKRLVDYLCERGQALLTSKGAGALELFNRVLNIDKDNEFVLRHLRNAEVKQRNRRIAMIGTGVVLLTGLSFVAKDRFAQTDNSSNLVALNTDAGVVIRDTRADASGPSPRDADTLLGFTGIADAGRADAKLTQIAVIRRRRADAGVVRTSPTTRTYTLSLSPRSSEFRIDNGPWQASTTGRETLKIPSGAKSLSARNPSCCEEQRIAIREDAVSGCRGSKNACVGCKNDKRD